MAKCFIFLCIFGDLDRVETGVSEEGVNSLKTLPKSSKLLWRVKTLIINRQNSILRFLIYFLYKYYIYPSLKLEQVHFVYLLQILFAKPEINRPDVFAEPPVSHSTDCQPCL